MIEAIYQNRKNEMRRTKKISRAHFLHLGGVIGLTFALSPSLALARPKEPESLFPDTGGSNTEDLNIAAVIIDSDFEGRVTGLYRVPEKDGWLKWQFDKDPLFSAMENIINANNFSSINTHIGWPNTISLDLGFVIDPKGISFNLNLETREFRLRGASRQLTRDELLSADNLNVTWSNGKPDMLGIFDSQGNELHFTTPIKPLS